MAPHETRRIPNIVLPDGNYTGRSGKPGRNRRASAGLFGAAQAAFVLACLLPSWFPAIAYGFGALCWLTTTTRIAVAWQMLR